jgi:hypothetical protein
MKFGGWNDDDVYGPEEDLASRARHQQEFLKKMAAWCRPGRIMRLHFPNPKHDSHVIHGRLVELVEEDVRGKVAPSFNRPTGNVWHTRYIDDGEAHVYHVLEMRPIDPLTALACTAE